MAAAASEEGASGAKWRKWRINGIEISAKA